MRARKFNKRVSIYSLTATSDGYGGNTISEALVANRWANIESLRSANITDFGLDQNKLSMRFTMRKLDGITLTPATHFIKYNGDWNIVSFPENKDFDNRYVTFIATKSD